MAQVTAQSPTATPGHQYVFAAKEAAAAAGSYDVVVGEVFTPGGVRGETYTGGVRAGEARGGVSAVGEINA